MNLNKKNLLFICVIGGAFQANALPLSEHTAEQYYKYNDFDNMIKLNTIDSQKYTNYAINKVDMALQGRVVPDQIRQQAIREVEVVYKNFVEEKMEQIQREAIQKYKSEFTKTQTEESVKHQINFYQSNQGKNILAKQQIRRTAIQNLQKTIPLALASQSHLQATLSQVLEGSN
ncbi:MULTISPECIES: hypothetical protein [Acinetobacter]|uniref:DUF2059 domain-containing protein n=1 Tax=Acinetobacter piscicola TaxID=2006115 RepID=A0A7S6VY54_9GAMM|nr:MULTISPECIES: hypothetical protein [Acinetobacter]QOW47028.1 hypothetical protein G0028_14670 [Acinetobacter piscicola]